MDLDRAKKELSNEYKIFEIQIETSLQLSLTIYSTIASKIIFFIIFSHFLCIFQLWIFFKLEIQFTFIFQRWKMYQTGYLKHFKVIFNERLMIPMKPLHISHDQLLVTLFNRCHQFS